MVRSRSRPPAAHASRVPGPDQALPPPQQVYVYAQLGHWRRPPGLWLRKRPSQQALPPACRSCENRPRTPIAWHSRGHRVAPSAVRLTRLLQREDLAANAPAQTLFFTVHDP